MTQGRRRLVAALMVLSGCHAPAAQIGAVQESRADLPAACGSGAALQATLRAGLARGEPPETSPAGRCVAHAAQTGSIAGAMLIADIYAGAMAQNGAAGGPAALRLDLFGRHMHWLRRAAELGYAPAQWRLAQEADQPTDAPMSFESLAWYQAAAENGSLPALQALASAYAQGRISDERLYDLRKWLAGQAGHSAADHAILQLMNRRPGNFP